MEGQLWPEERKFLHEAILVTKPQLVIEVGTWKGGGSTLQIAEALRKNGFGHLMTCELDKALFEEANAIYDNNTWYKWVTCHNCASEELIKSCISHGTIPDFLFFDGPDDPDTALNDLQIISPHLKVDSHFCMHDFITTKRSDGLTALKAKRIRPYLEQSEEWELVGLLEEPISVGICLFKKVL
jgi:predicted O-methyltransferase YrrM